jgi:hypothetical protein
LGKGRGAGHPRGWTLIRRGNLRRVGPQRGHEASSQEAILGCVWSQRQLFAAKNHEILRKDRVARKAWKGEYRGIAMKPLKRRETLRRELLSGQIEISGCGVSGNIRKEALKWGKTSWRSARAERIPGGTG